MKKLKIKPQIFTVVLSIVFSLGCTITALASEYHYYGENVYIGDKLEGIVATTTYWNINDYSVSLDHSYIGYNDIALSNCVFPHHNYTGGAGEGGWSTFYQQFGVTDEETFESTYITLYTSYSFYGEVSDWSEYGY